MGRSDRQEDGFIGMIFWFGCFVVLISFLWYKSCSHKPKGYDKQNNKSKECRVLCS